MPHRTPRATPCSAACLKTVRCLALLQMDSAEHAVLRIVLNHETDTKIKKLQEELAQERAAHRRTREQCDFLFKVMGMAPHSDSKMAVSYCMMKLAKDLEDEAQYDEAERVYLQCIKINPLLAVRIEWMIGCELQPVNDNARRFRKIPPMEGSPAWTMRQRWLNDTTEVELKADEVDDPVVVEVPKRALPLFPNPPTTFEGIPAYAG